MLRSCHLAGLAMLAGLTLEVGKAAKVTLLQGGATIEGPRVP